MIANNGSYQRQIVEAVLTGDHMTGESASELGGKTMSSAFSSNHLIRRTSIGHAVLNPSIYRLQRVTANSCMQAQT